MVHTLRTRFKKDIVTEFLPPARPMKRVRVAIICPGMPSAPSATLLRFLSKKGFWTFLPRYRGSWESGGRFLKKSPHEDIIDIINELPKGFQEAWAGRKYKLSPDEIVIFGGSFGGPAGILASRDPRVSKVIAMSPVVDWRAPSRTESLEFMRSFVARAFGDAYRFGATEWKKLKTGTFYNPVHVQTEINGAKLFIIHAKDDDVVRFKDVAQFARATGAKFKPLKTGGHFRMATIVERCWKEIAKFLRERS